MTGEAKPIILILIQNLSFLLPTSPAAPSEKICGRKKVIWGRKSGEKLVHKAALLALMDRTKHVFSFFGLETFAPLLS